MQYEIFIKTLYILSGGESSLVVVSIENIIASCSLEHPVELQQIALNTSNATFDKERGNLLSIQWEQPRIACLINAKGKIIFTGAHSQEEIQEGLDRLRETLDAQHIDIPEQCELEITQVIASTQLDTPLKLDQVQKQLPDDAVIYHSEQTPYIEYRLQHPNTVILVFNTGSLVACGPSIDDVSKPLQDLAETVTKKI